MICSSLSSANVWSVSRPLPTALTLGMTIAMLAMPLLAMPLLATPLLAEEKRDDTPESPTGTRIAVANRAGGNITLIDGASERTLTIELEPGSEPMYAQNPFFSDEIWIGDRGNDRVLIYDALRLRRVAEIPTGEGVFHMWNHGTLRQFWVVADVDKSMTVIDLDTRAVLATVPIPADLEADFKPHDITVTPDSAIVTLLGTTDPSVGYLVKYSGSTFEETARLEVGGDPHVFYWGFEESRLYVATQRDGRVLWVDPVTLNICANLKIPGAHGIWANEDETHLYVGNIESADGLASIYTIDIPTFTVTSIADGVLPNPHNLMVSIDNTKLFVTHSGGDSVSSAVYDVNPATGEVSNGRVVTADANPFGIMLIRDPLCEVGAKQGRGERKPIHLDAN